MPADTDEDPQSRVRAIDSSAIVDARMIIECADLAATLDYFTEMLGFRVDRIFPADDPRVADVSAHGLGITLRRSAAGRRGAMRLVLDGSAGSVSAGIVTAPDGTIIEIVERAAELAVAPLAPSLVVSRLDAGTGFGVGRAGMGYRDLVPDRQGGRFVASHIWIENGGEVPDYVHHHDLRFQMIFCYRGWVRVAYEDQGDPLVMEPGDCVLQPPGIRHRVLESSPGLEVIEIACPAEHDTFADHDLTLPTGAGDPRRRFGGQRFVHHVASAAPWGPWRFPGFECRDTGIDAATDGLAGVRVLRSTGPSAFASWAHHGEFELYFVLTGEVVVTVTGRVEELAAGGCIVVPPATTHRIEVSSPETEILEVSLPA
ncbi:MAG: cupin domain-containing protein [Acidimicrobiales bacterium]